MNKSKIVNVFWGLIFVCVFVQTNPNFSSYASLVRNTFLILTISLPIAIYLTTTGRQFPLFKILVFITLFLLMYFSVQNLLLDGTDFKMLIIFYIRIIFVGLLIVSLALLDIPKFVYVLDRFLFISAFFLYLQFSLSASGVGFINFHNIFFPWSNNYEIVSFGITRMNSFYMEPGAYGNIVGLLTALSLILHNKIKKRHVFYSFSIIMSFALSSFFFFILLVILSCCFVKRKNLIKSFIASVFLSSIVVFIALETGVFDYGYERLSNIESNGSANVKVDNFDAWKNYSLERKLFGQSIFVNSDVESVNSNGFLFYSLYYWGVIGLLLSFMPFLISVIRMNAKLAIFCVMLYASRYSFNYPTGIFLVYFIIGLLYLRNETNLLSTEQREHLQ